MTSIAGSNPFIEHPAESHDVNDGVQYKFKFANGYGASVVKGPYTYGGPSGLWELAVLGQDGRLTYSTPITSDVEGWLSDDAVRELLRQVAELPAPVAAGVSL